jgi:GTP-binding protein HflX
MRNVVTKLERAVLVGIVLPEGSEAQTQTHLSELEHLAYTSGAETIAVFTQKLSHPNPNTLLGSGKLEEIRQYVQEEGADTLIFDEELSATQIRNLEHWFGEVKILDRTNLILDIFAMRAQTAQAKTQVELAQFEYLLPRLTQMWTHLSRQKGGIGMKGPGEKEIETDRRIVRRKISLLKEKLRKFDRQEQTRRKSRGDKVRVALVGYTNAGKSTVMNLLAKSHVQAEDKLFATLDTTVRKVVLEQTPFLLSDTVGFIRKLPHGLVESFQSTLDEVRESDVLLHIIDMSSPHYNEQIEAVRQTLSEMGVLHKPTLLVFNKTDRIPQGNALEREALQKEMTELVKRHQAHERLIFISALQKHALEDLRAEVAQLVSEQYARRYPNTVQ